MERVCFQEYLHTTIAEKRISIRLQKNANKTLGLQRRTLPPMLQINETVERIRHSIDQSLTMLLKVGTVTTLPWQNA